MVCGIGIQSLSNSTFFLISRNILYSSTLWKNYQILLSTTYILQSSTLWKNYYLFT